MLNICSTSVAAQWHRSLSFLFLSVRILILVGVIWDLTKGNRKIVFHSLFLLLLFQRSPLLHEVTVETRLFSLLLLQVDAGDESSPVELNLMFFFVTDSHIMYTLITYTNVFRIIVTQVLYGLTSGCSRPKYLQKRPTQTQTSCR